MINLCNFLTPNAEDVIERKGNFRDLGIRIKENVDFTDHTYYVCARINDEYKGIM